MQHQQFNILSFSNPGDHKKSEKYGTNLCPTSNNNQDLVPWIGEEQLATAKHNRYAAW